MSSSSSPPTTTVILDVENLKAHQGSDQTLFRSKMVELGNSKGKRVHSKSESTTGESATGNRGNSNSKPATGNSSNSKPATENSSQLSMSPAVASQDIHIESAKHEDEADSMDIDQR